MPARPIVMLVRKPLTVAGLVLAVSVLPLAGCSSGNETRPNSSPETTPSPEILRVTCVGKSLRIATDSVAATAAGVTLRVKNRGPAGTYLNYSSLGVSGGDPAPRKATLWTLSFPPGQLVLSCSDHGLRGKSVRVEVEDPGHHWRTTSLRDLDCPGVAQPMWRFPTAKGPTPPAAAGALARGFDRIGQGRPGPLTPHVAAVGYPDDPSQTWLLSDSRGPYASARVVHADGQGFLAAADRLC